jgi:hypothetical protein
MQLEERSGSSPELEEDIEAQAATESTDKPGETEDNLLAVVQSVVEKSDAQTAEASTSDSPPEESDQQKPAEAEDRKEDDFTDVPFNKHPRFQKLVQEKNSYKAKLAEYEPDARQYREIQTFMETNQLTPEEVAEGFAIMAQMKSGDPAKAYEALQKQVEALAERSGKKLPASLQERVEQGYVDEETARSLYQSQLQAQRQAEQAERQLQMRSQQDERQQVVSIASAVQAWESATKGSDPDFELKVDLVKDRVRAHVLANGMPRSADEAVRLSKDAYESVSEVLRRAKGPKQAMRPAVGGKVNGSAAPEPKNLLDVIRRASAGA